MNTNAVVDNIRTILIDRYAVEPGLTPQTPFEHLDLDSLVMLELAVLIEKTYGVSMTGEELSAAGNVAQVATLITTNGG
jgi:acyl carrier protein